MHFRLRTLGSIFTKDKECWHLCSHLHFAGSRSLCKVKHIFGGYKVLIVGLRSKYDVALMRFKLFIITILFEGDRIIICGSCSCFNSSCFFLISGDGRNQTTENRTPYFVWMYLNNLTITSTRLVIIYAALFKHLKCKPKCFTGQGKTSLWKNKTV